MGNRDEPIGDGFRLCGRRVLLPTGLASAEIVVRDGRVTAVHERGTFGATDCAPLAAATADTGADLPRLDAADLVVLPGLVDTHVHVNEPGRTEWEGFATATAAAAAGGITTLVDMPLNAIPATTTVSALEAKRTAAAGACRVDVGFWGGLVPGNAAELEPLLDAGVLGFKCFLVESGVPEFRAVDEGDLRRALPILARRNAPLLVHAELPGPIAAAQAASLEGDWRRHATWLASRPVAAEVAAIELLARLAREFGARVHVVHLAAAEGVSILAGARRAGTALTAETCPHYLVAAAEEIPDGATLFKCAPPIREARHREALWAALESGELDLVASDHSPSPPKLKEVASGRFDRAWGGIASVQLGLPLVWSALRTRGHDVAAAATRVSRWMAEGPARLAGFARRKGALAVGADADFLFWDPEARWSVVGSRLRHRHPLSPYEERRLEGRVIGTWLRGRRVFAADEETVGSPTGRFLPRMEGTR